MATAFGQFLEYSLPTGDIRVSLDFYRRLGFSELPVGDIRAYHYGVVSDGRIALGLHGGGIDEPALSFVKSGVADSMPDLVTDEDTISFTRLGHESFHEIGMQSPDGHLIVMMEARTFSRADLSELPEPVIGRTVEISLGCRSTADSVRFWTNAGLQSHLDSDDEADAQSVELLAPGLRLGLRSEIRPGDMALRFAPDDIEQTLVALERENVPVHKKGDRHRVVSPEGINLELVTANL